MYGRNKRRSTSFCRAGTTRCRCTRNFTSPCRRARSTSCAQSRQGVRERLRDHRPLRRWTHWAFWAPATNRSAFIRRRSDNTRPESVASTVLRMSFCCVAKVRCFLLTLRHSQTDLARQSSRSRSTLAATAMGHGRNLLEHWEEAPTAFCRQAAFAYASSHVLPAP